MEKGIILLTMARSRSSMTAEIFRNHGVFFGETWRPGHGRLGYNENIALKQWGRKQRPTLYDQLLAKDGGVLDIPESVLERIFRDDGYDVGPWAIKVDAFCRAPGIQIGIWRKPEAIVASCMRAMRARTETDWREIVQAHHDRLKSLDIPLIDTDALVAGDDASLEAAFKVCGLSYDKQKTEAAIRRD